MNERITVTVNEKKITAVKGVALSEIVNGEKPCGGHGKCGKCKVTVSGDVSAPCSEEKTLLSAEELKAGVRLACLTYALGDCHIKNCAEKSQAQILTDGDLELSRIAPAFSKYGFAIDIGTTTVAARLYDTEGVLLASASRLNPQSKWGADVVSRIEASLAGNGKTLANSIRQLLNELSGELSRKACINANEIDGIVITGNTVMLSLLVEESVEPFSHAPFDAKRLFGETFDAKTIGLTELNPQASVYLPPCISAFVGADTVCAILSTKLIDNGIAMLVDIGTNGEMAMWDGSCLRVCSTAAGPAFEGVGISMGMRGELGAIDKVIISGGELKPHVIGEVTPRGICGSGLVDAVACMLKKEIIDETGYLEDEECLIGESVSLLQKDIRMFQLAKSAICAGLMTLVHNCGLEPGYVTKLYVAGGFGNYLDMQNASDIGLLPQMLAKNAKVVGNAALSGACMLLLDKNTRSLVDVMAKSAVTLELSTNPAFSNYYIENMCFCTI